MKIRNVVLAAALGTALTGAASAQVISYSPRTGDIWIDTQLGYMNDYGRDNRDYFVNDVVYSFGAPRYLVNELVTTRRWAPGDVYYACALAYQLHRPCGDVVRNYEQNRGQGWGVVAMRLGIKPGSAQFFAMKGHVGKSNDKFKTHWHNGNGAGPGNSGKHDQGNSDHGQGNSGKHDQGDSDHGQGNSGKHDQGDSDHGQGNSDHGQGNSGKAGKGNDKSKGGGH